MNSALFVLVMSTCGQSTNRNCTNFVNIGYPRSIDKAGTCQLTIHKAHPDVCQYRYVFYFISVISYVLYNMVKKD